MSFRQIPLAIKKEIRPNLEIAAVIPVENGNILLKYEGSPMLSKLDEQLEVLWTKDFGLRSKNYVYADVSAHPNGTLYGITESDNFRLMTPSGGTLFSYEHDDWPPFMGANCFFAGRWVLFIIPTPTGDKLLQLDLETLGIAARYDLEGDQEYRYTFTATPDPGIIFIDAAAGQDDAHLFIITIQKDGRLDIAEATQCLDRIVGNFSPDGQSFVMAPHYDEGIEIYSFPAIARIAGLPQETLFAGRNEYPCEDEDTIDYTVLFLNDQLLISLTRFGRLLLIDRATMACTGELLLEGNEIIAYDQGGKPVTGDADILDYSGEVGDVIVVPAGLLAVHSSGSLRLYGMEGIGG